MQACKKPRVSDFIPALHKSVMVVCICNPSVPEIEAELEVPGHPWLHGEFEATLGYLRPYFKVNPSYFLNIFDHTVRYGGLQ